jgi:hypothetical protein
MLEITSKASYHLGSSTVEGFFVMRCVLPVALVLSIGAAFVGASAQTAPVTPAATPAAVDPDSVVTCRSERITGQLIPKKTCHTAAEWAQLSAEGREMMGDIDRRGSIHNAPNPGG